METTLTAAFKKKTDLDLAAKALRKQGVLDLRIHNVIENKESSGTTTYSMDVFVEKSRWRQAEDTLIRHGGQL
ncbi:hypothetical protein EHS13_35750 [Paenibacillus psychroresistens]|uniref:DUF2007 domain-containing protein n=1 Tax=Paenibacillus psychroresistens TaxID=1778678 RepID=A0A6B8RWU2_9BACL|nr:hypothetical protein [Paenibacillus psychroresistens]QGQ99843.1 hypothetical protein EHS13_35750 [Paenibacillus psychroresistens]